MFRGYFFSAFREGRVKLYRVIRSPLSVSAGQMSRNLNGRLIVGFLVLLSWSQSNANAQNYSLESDAHYREAISQLATSLRNQLNVDVDVLNLSLIHI